MTQALVRYIRSFTGFSRDARLFLITTIVFGAALSLYWADFNLYLGAIGLDRSTMGRLLIVIGRSLREDETPCPDLLNS